MKTAVYNTFILLEFLGPSSEDLPDTVCLECHVFDVREEMLTQLMNIARCFQVVPMMRVLLPMLCFASKAWRERSLDYKQAGIDRDASDG